MKGNIYPYARTQIYRWLMEVLKSKASYAEAREALKNSICPVKLSELLKTAAEGRGIKPADVMRRSGLKKSYFYQLLDGKRENPSRDTLIQLGFGLGFSLDEMQEFLTTFGAAQLYPRIARDGVMIYAFQHGLDIIECDILLAENGEKTLMKA